MLQARQRLLDGSAAQPKIFCKPLSYQAFACCEPPRQNAVTQAFPGGRGAGRAWWSPQPLSPLELPGPFEVHYNQRFVPE